MSRRASLALALAALAALAAAPLPIAAQTVSGTAFHDRDADGVREPGEEPLSGVAVRLYGQRDAGGAFDEGATTGATGEFSFAPGNGCYLLDLEDPPGWRRTLARTDEFAPGSPGYTHPVGVRRFGAGLTVLENLAAGTLRYTSMGDSIAWNWNSCFDTSSFWYSTQVRDRLRCVAPAASVNLDQAAVKGEHTDDLLVDDADMNNVFRVIDAQSRLVTISIIGNDLLDDEPSDGANQQQVNRAVAEILDARANLQEILSSLTWEIPGGAVELNTLYDNLAWNCASANSPQFHREWLPILNQALRDLAWGQVRRVTNAEVFLDFSHEDLLNGCAGFQDQICHLLGDDIHPKASGYRVVREKVWESLGGASLGPKDGIGATSIGGANQGYLRRQLRLYPTRWELRGGAAASDPAAALDGDDAGAAAAVRLGVATEEFRLSGFPGWYDEIVPVKVIAGVRYRTSGTVSDDFYRVEASVNDQFRPPPGHAYTTTNWNFFTPIVGAGGPNAPAEDPDYPDAKLLVRPNVAAWREASATLTKNPVPAGDGRGYAWPPLTNAELATSTIRLASAPVAGTPGDDYQVLVDAAWLDVYGLAKPRPPEITGVRVTRSPAGDLVVSFAELAGSELYNLYLGDLAHLAADGEYDHGARASCGVATEGAGEGRLATTLPAAQVPAADAYILVTGRVDGVESPTGAGSAGVERDRSQNVCP